MRNKTARQCPRCGEALVYRAQSTYRGLGGRIVVIPASWGHEYRFADLAGTAPICDYTANIRIAGRRSSVMAGIYEYFCHHNGYVVIVQAEPDADQLPLCPECGGVASPDAEVEPSACA